MALIYSRVGTDDAITDAVEALTPAAVGAAALDHAHAISDVTGLQAALDEAGNSAPAFEALTDGVTITWALGAAKIASATVTLGGNRALAITGLTNGARGLLIVTQDETGGRTLTLPEGSLVAGNGEGAVTLTAAPGAVDVLSFVYDGTRLLWTVEANYTGTPPTYDYMLDRFTGTDGALLSARSLETGEAWAAGSHDFEIAANKARAKGTSHGDICIVTAPSGFGADVTVEVAVTPKNESSLWAGIVGRATDASNYWFICLAYAGNGFRIYSVEAGVESGPHAFAGPTLALGDTYLLRVTFSGATITATLDGANTITYSSATFNQTAEGFGLRAQHTTEITHRDIFDDFLLWEGGGGPPNNPVYP